MRMTVAAAVACAIVGLANAQESRAALRQYDLNIPRQSLDLALKDLAQQTGLQIARLSESADGAAVVGPVSGSLTPGAALESLLRTQGLTFEIVDERTIAVFRVAQSSAAVPAESADDARLEEIVVTAQKRTERLIDTPQSVTVLSADTLARLGATQFRDFADTIPGLSLSTAGAGVNQISLRGVTVGSDISSTVGIYVDEVPYGSSTAFARSAQLALDAGLFDLQRIEVLRGPQGTLYGASTMGGLLKYVTRQPDVSRLGGATQAGISSTHSGGLSYHAAGTLNAPLVSEKMAVRATGFYSRDGGYIDNLALGQKNVDRAASYGGRADLLFAPTEAFNIRIVGFLQNISRDGFQSAGYTLAGDPVDSSLDQRRALAEPFDQRFRLTSATVTYDLEGASLTSISSYQTVRTEQLWDLSVSYTPFCAFVARTCGTVGMTDEASTDKFTQEIRLAADGARKVEWVVGGYYTHETSRFLQEFVLSDTAGQPLPNDLFGLTWPTRYQEYAAFGDLTWRLTDKLDVTGGVRYAHNSQKFGQLGLGPFVVSTPTTRSNDHVFTYLANTRYHFNDHAVGYLRYATGYRPGGPNPILIDPTTGEPTSASTFDADELKSYEAGFKGETADRRFGIDVAAYAIDWSDIQIVVVRGGIGGRANAPGGATIRGAELGLTARPIRSLTTTATFAYQHGEMSQADTDLGVAKGERLPNVPRFSAALSTDYALAAGGVQPRIGATVRYVDDRRASFDRSTSAPQYVIPSYTTADVRAGLTLGSVDLQLYVRNIFDERGQQRLPITGIFPTGGPILVSIMQPRTAGLTISTEF